MDFELSGQSLATLPSTVVKIYLFRIKVVRQIIIFVWYELNQIYIWYATEYYMRAKRKGIKWLFTVI